MELKLLTIKEVSKILDVKEETCRTWIKRKVIPDSIVKKLGSQIRIPQVKLEKWLLNEL